MLFETNLRQTVSIYMWTEAMNTIICMCVYSERSTGWLVSFCLIFLDSSRCRHGTEGSAKVSRYWWRKDCWQYSRTGVHQLIGHYHCQSFSSVCDVWFLLHSQVERQHQEWLEDLVIRLLCVFALDRFGDFVSDEVCHLFPNF